MLGIVRSAQLVMTLIVVGPVGIMGLITMSTGRIWVGLFWVAVAIGMAVVSEYVYSRLVNQTMGHFKRFVRIPEQVRNGRT